MSAFDWLKRIPVKAGDVALSVAAWVIVKELFRWLRKREKAREARSETPTAGPGPEGGGTGPTTTTDKEK